MFAMDLLSQQDAHAVRAFINYKLPGVVINIVVDSNVLEVWLTHGHADGTLTCKPPRMMPVICCWPKRQQYRTFGDWDEPTWVRSNGHLSVLVVPKSQEHVKLSKSLIRYAYGNTKAMFTR